MTRASLMTNPRVVAATGTTDANPVVVPGLSKGTDREEKVAEKDTAVFHLGLAGQDTTETEVADRDHIRATEIDETGIEIVTIATDGVLVRLIILPAVVTENTATVKTERRPRTLMLLLLLLVSQ